MGAKLIEFRKFDPPKYAGKKEEKGVLERWLTNMEKLLEDLFIDEQDRVPLAAHFLDGDASSWWRRHLSLKLGNVFPPWGEFRRLLHEQFFRDNTKLELERELNVFSSREPYRS
uniref:Retrotransposon gag domain-containing protein n=1 Tax=Ananas comosus var. bracteatus TaxID=296719 RepID=A0A6V7Q5S5_ANACO|nr:unnamed protein product [Ananas comosus var. bracteatus]